MQVVDLTAGHHDLYFKCLEDWSDEMNEAGSHKAIWFDKMKDMGLRVKLALDDGNRVGGMIQYLPVEHSFVEGRDLYFITCIWVHGYKKGRGDFQKQGMGKALLQAAEDDVKARGAKGIAAWGLILPFWMKAAWFRKQGYKPVDRMGIQALVWKPFTKDAAPPKWIKERRKPETVAGKVTVTCCLNGWCPAQNIVFERAKRAASEIGDKIVFRHIDTSDRNTLLDWGMVDALFIDGKRVRTGPPPSYEKIKKLITARAKRLK